MESDFDLVLEYLTEFMEFVKPVSSLVSDWFQAMYRSIPEFEKLFFIVVTLAIITFLGYVVDRVSSM